MRSRSLARLGFHQYEPIPAVVTHHGLYAVRAVRGRLREFHALGAEVLVRFLAVIDSETEPAHPAIGERAAYNVGQSRHRAAAPAPSA